MRLEFNNQLVPQSSLDIEDIGNSAIEAVTPDSLFFYYVNTTKFGKTTTITFGPIVPDMGFILDDFTLYVHKSEYSQPKLAKALNIWLNDKKKLEKAKLVSIEEALSNIPDVKNYYINYKEIDDG